MVILLPFFVALGAAVLPPLLWLFFFTREDRHPEPPALIAYTFALGGIISLPTLLAQQLLKNTVAESALFLLVALALIEELFKFFASFISTNRSRAFDEPLDAMIYTITAALGFAAIENFFYIAGNWQLLVSLVPSDAVLTSALRFIGATLLHALASGLVGYFWARGIMTNRRGIFIATGLVLATAVHSVFNALIARFQAESNLLFPSVFLLVILFFVLVDFEKLKGARRVSGTP